MWFCKKQYQMHDVDCCHVIHLHYACNNWKLPILKFSEVLLKKYNTDVIVIQKSIIHATKCDFAKKIHAWYWLLLYISLIIYVFWLEITNIEIFRSLLEKLQYRGNSNPKNIMRTAKCDFENSITSIILIVVM